MGRHHPALVVLKCHITQLVALPPAGPLTELECGQEPGCGEDVEGGLVEDVERDVEGVPNAGGRGAVWVVLSAVGRHSHCTAQAAAWLVAEAERCN